MATSPPDAGTVAAEVRGERPIPAEIQHPGILRWLLEYGAAGVFEEYDSFEAWWQVFKEHRRHWPSAVDQALVGGIVSDRLAYAFAAGYQAALRALVPSVPEDRVVSFSVTEEGGAHPRAVKSTLRPASGAAGEVIWRLNGKKKWTTLSCDAGLALIVASTGSDESGRNTLRVAEFPLDAPGVVSGRAGANSRDRAVLAPGSARSRVALEA